MFKLWKGFRSEKGFTLVELMVVVVIIGVLVAIAIPIFNNVSGNAKDKACAANVRTLSGLAAMYHAQNDEYPDSVQDLLDSDLLQENIECPWGGTYGIDGNTGIASCNHEEEEESTP